MNLENGKTDLKAALGPSKFSAQGYLGNDERAPEEIIQEDLIILARLGIGKNNLVAALRKTYITAERALGNPVEISPGVIAVHHEARGRIPSPFPEDGTLPKGETVVTDKKSGESIVITPLSMMLIERHDFFQGKGSAFRIDPEVAIRLLGINRI
ncbi:MAG TPA: hypothetical protein VLX68_09670 [Chitinivibrionales bacterium]|nr:hypothetical protein [Chitinivibrionales bacterium]